MKRRGLKGNPDATIDQAREMIKVARSEAGSKPRSLPVRQAAEKVWLAASTAADAMIGPVDNASQVFRAFRRAWGPLGEQLARDIETSLHRGCFYSDARGCDGPYVTRYATQLGRLLKKPIRDREIKARLTKRK